MVFLFQAGVLPAQTLPATAPTVATSTTTTSPIAGLANQSNSRPHRAEVTCANGQLEVHAQNSSLNSILRAVSNCTGMRITGGVPEQRVFGNYGPAAPATILATLLDGTGSNMLLKETAADQPAELILTPRTGGVTPPPPSTYNEADAEDTTPTSPNPNPNQQPPNSPPNRYLRSPYTRPNPQTGGAVNPQQPNQTPVLPPIQGSVVTSPPSIPQPINNVNGSPSNTSPTPGTYPTTNSVPLDSVATPSTTPSSNGIVDSPNPPPAGSDTAAALNGAPAGTPGTTNINPAATSQTTTPGATNTTTPATNANQPPADLTPEQIFQQLQQRQQHNSNSNSSNSNRPTLNSRSSVR